VHRRIGQPRGVTAAWWLMNMRSMRRYSGQAPRMRDSGPTVSRLSMASSRLRSSASGSTVTRVVVPAATAGAARSQRIRQRSSACGSTGLAR
jgi:hypothetical protein